MKEEEKVQQRTKKEKTDQKESKSKSAGGGGLKEKQQREKDRRRTHSELLRPASKEVPAVWPGPAGPRGEGQVEVQGGTPGPSLATEGPRGQQGWRRGAVSCGPGKAAASRWLEPGLQAATASPEFPSPLIWGKNI